MTMQSILPWYLASLRATAIALVMLATTFCSASDSLGRISGIVRDAQGKSLEGVSVTLTIDQTPPTSTRTNSSKEGEYQFIDVPPGNYHLTATLTGFAATDPGVVRIVKDSGNTTVNFILTPHADNAEGTTAAPSRPPLKFQAAGVRGLIDAGGYSAPANAAAASVLIAGIADIKRSGNDLGVSSGLSANWPCALEPELKKAVEANPEKSEPNRRLGEFYLAHDQAAKAIPPLETARQIEDTVSTRDAITRHLAIALMKAGQFDAARDLLSAEVGEENKSEFHTLLARANEGSGLFKQAAEEYRIAAGIDPVEESLFGVGYELILAGAPEDAAKAFKSGVERYPQSITLLMGAGAAEFLQGNASESVVWLLRSTGVDPADPRPYALLSSASSVSGAESERVRASFKRFLDLAPASAHANYFYAVNLLGGPPPSQEQTKPAIGDEGGIDRAEALIKRAIQLDPNLATAHFQLGVIYSRKGDNDNAVREYEEAVRLAPDLKEAHYRLSGAYRHAGRSQEADREMQAFQEARGRTDAQVGNIEQLVSVMRRPQSRGSSGEECPAPSR